MMNINASNAQSQSKAIEKSKRKDFAATQPIVVVKNTDRPDSQEQQRKKRSNADAPLPLRKSADDCDINLSVSLKKQENGEENGMNKQEGNKLLILSPRAKWDDDKSGDKQVKAPAISQKAEQTVKTNETSKTGNQSDTEKKMLSMNPFGKIKGLRGTPKKSKNPPSGKKEGEKDGNFNDEAMWMEKANDPETQVFGMPLEMGIGRGMDDSKKENIPLVIYRCTHIVRNYLQEVGVFRLSGSHGRIQYWKKRYDLGDDPDLSQESDIHVISGVFKLYLRELPETILTKTLLPQYEATLSLTDNQAKVMYLKYLSDQLPEANKKILHWILILLLDLIRYSEKNLMNVENVSLIFSPTLKCSVVVVQLLLENFESIFL